MEDVLKGYKYRIYPNEEQKVLLAKSFGCYRLVFNKFLEKKIILYRKEEKTMSHFDGINWVTQKLSVELPFLRECERSIYGFAIQDVIYAYNNFFREIKKGNKDQGFPKFKDKSSPKKYRTGSPSLKADFDKGQVYIPKLKWVDAVIHRKCDGDIRNATVSQAPSGKYYIMFCVKTDHEEMDPADGAIGLDLGIKDLMVTSEGVKYGNNKLIRKYEKKMGRASRSFSRKKKGSSNWYKAKLEVAKLHERITAARRDNLHKISHKVVKDNHMIFSENLNVKGMVRNKNLAKSIVDCSWSELTRQLDYKSEWNNRIYHKVDRFYPSSQLCSSCGYKHEDVKNLKVRVWECPECETEHDRDMNASINVLNQGLKELGVQ